MKLGNGERERGEKGEKDAFEKEGAAGNDRQEGGNKSQSYRQSLNANGLTRIEGGGLKRLRGGDLGVGGLREMQCL